MMLDGLGEGIHGGNADNDGTLLDNIKIILFILRIIDIEEG